MYIRIAVVSLWAEDVPSAAHFYRDVLGLPLQAHHAGDRPHFDLGGISWGSQMDVLVEYGCFFLSKNGICLSFSEEMTWEKYTALLLLQQGFKTCRALERKRP